MPPGDRARIQTAAIRTRQRRPCRDRIEVTAHVSVSAQELKSPKGTTVSHPTFCSLSYHHAEGERGWFVRLWGQSCLTPSGPLPTPPERSEHAVSKGEHMGVTEVTALRDALQ